MKKLNLIFILFLWFIGSSFISDLNAARAKSASGGIKDTVKQFAKSQDVKEFVGLKKTEDEIESIRQKRRKKEEQQEAIKGVEKNLDAIIKEGGEVKIGEETVVDEKQKGDERKEAVLSWLRKKDVDIDDLETTKLQSQGNRLSEEIEILKGKESDPSYKRMIGLVGTGLSVAGGVSGATVLTEELGEFGEKAGIFDEDEDEEIEYDEEGNEITKKPTEKTKKKGIEGVLEKAAVAVGIKKAADTEKKEEKKTEVKKTATTKVPEFLKIPDGTEFSAEDAENYLKMVASYADSVLKKARAAFIKKKEPVTITIASGEKVTVVGADYAKEFLDEYKSVLEFYKKKRDAYKALLKDRKELVQQQEGKEGSSLLLAEEKIKDLDEEIKTSKAIYKEAQKDAQEAWRKKEKGIKERALFFQLPEEGYSAWRLSKVGVAQANKATKDFNEIDIAEIFNFLQELEIPAADLLPVSTETTAKEKKDIEEELFEEIEEEVEVKEEPKSWLDKLKETGKKVAIEKGTEYKEKAVDKAKATGEEYKEKAKEKVEEYRGEPTEEEEAEDVAGKASSFAKASEDKEEPMSWLDKLKEKGKEVYEEHGDEYKEKVVTAAKEKVEEYRGEPTEEEETEDVAGKASSFAKASQDKEEEAWREEQVRRAEEIREEDIAAIKRATEPEEGSIEWARVILDKNETLKNKIKSALKIKVVNKRKNQFKNAIKGTPFAEGVFSDLSLEDEMKILQEAVE